MLYSVYECNVFTVVSIKLELYRLVLMLIGLNYVYLHERYGV